MATQPDIEELLGALMAGFNIPDVVTLRQVQRAGGCRLWVCPSCDPAGTSPVAVVETLRDIAATCTATGTARPTEHRPGVRWATTK